MLEYPDIATQHLDLQENKEKIKKLLEYLKKETLNIRKQIFLIEINKPSSLIK